MERVGQTRPGGRSARVQRAVHDAVQGLLIEFDRSHLTVPLVAARAGVTPSTIYRRWGGLPDLLSDVAVERLRPESSPADLGGLAADLEAWACDFYDEMSSTPGRQYVEDALLGGHDRVNATRCSDYAVTQIEAVLERARSRGETVPDVDAVLDVVVAPLMYRILFRSSPSDRELVAPSVARVLADGVASTP